MQQKKDLYKLTSVDEYGSHVSIIPAEVSGFFRKNRSRVHALLLLIFLLTPWIHINEKQLILFDIPKREFIFFGLIFKPHDAPLIFLLLAIATLGLAFVTSVWGRIWCGWACPQTVFIDAVYRRIEILTEGKYIERRRLQSAPWTMAKFLKKATKWALFIFVSAIFSHSFAAYFTGSYELLAMMKGAPSENWNYFLLILFLTVIITFDFAWFREQFCVIMCPYGRIQSVLLESSSYTVAYDQQRGEPRRGLISKDEKQGDCIDCHRCVEVCPTGIDIRNGLQMECIACTACIDACNDIMKKVNKPPNLISYKTLDGSKFQVWKLKTVIYGLLIILSASVLAYNLQTREPVEVAFLRGLEAPYSKDVDSQGEVKIINHFRLHLVSQSSEDAFYDLQLADKDQKEGMSITVAQNPIRLKSRASETWHVFIKAPPTLLSSDGKRRFNILIKSGNGFVMNQELMFLGPVK